VQGQLGKAMRVETVILDSEELAAAAVLALLA
jgi:hypothetical protein